MMAGEIDKLDHAKIKEYAAASSRIGSAIEALSKHDGWQIFIALYARKKNEIKERRDYEDIVEFRADRKALDIVDALFDEMEGFVTEAGEAAERLSQISPDEGQSRGIMLIEQMEGSNRES